MGSLFVVFVVESFRKAMLFLFYKKVLDRETGEFKLVVDYYVCRSCDAAMRMRAKGV